MVVSQRFEFAGRGYMWLLVMPRAYRCRFGIADDRLLRLVFMRRRHIALYITVNISVHERR
jgi:hypothetical protein